jgi:NAD(P)-dependent dehydrogenase (short-subunit alcohol dehydrogenase family)
MASVIITGANGGLGVEVTNRLAEDGYHVLAVTGQHGAGKISGKKNITSFQVDLLKEDKAETFVNKAVETTSDLNAAVLLVGGFAMGKLSETSKKDLEKMIDLNFYTAFHLIRPLMKHFTGNPEGGRFILVGARPALDSSAGKDFFAYSLSKAMVIKLAEFINIEGKDKNISATVIIPSVIDTAANRQAMPDADFSKWVPPQAIAETISFYLSREGRMIREAVVKLYNRS